MGRAPEDERRCPAFERVFCSVMSFSESSRPRSGRIGAATGGGEVEIGVWRVGERW